MLENRLDGIDIETKTIQLDDGGAVDLSVAVTNITEAGLMDLIEGVKALTYVDSKESMIDALALHQHGFKLTGVKMNREKTGSFDILWTKENVSDTV